MYNKILINTNYLPPTLLNIHHCTELCPTTVLNTLNVHNIHPSTPYSTRHLPQYLRSSTAKTISWVVIASKPPCSPQFDNCFHFSSSGGRWRRRIGQPDWFSKSMNIEESKWVRSKISIASPLNMQVEMGQLLLIFKLIFAFYCSFEYHLRAVYRVLTLRECYCFESISSVILGAYLLADTKKTFPISLDRHFNLN